MLTSGRTRWLARATKEVEVVLEEIRRAEVLRAVEVDALGSALGLAPSPSLSRLAESVDEPWSSMLTQHRQAFLTMTAELTALAESNRDLLAAGARATREALLSLTDGAETCAAGATAGLGSYHRLLDQAR